MIKYLFLLQRLKQNFQKAHPTTAFPPLFLHIDAKSNRTPSRGRWSDLFLLRYICDVDPKAKCMLSNPKLHFKQTNKQKVLKVCKSGDSKGRWWAVMDQVTLCRNHHSHQPGFPSRAYGNVCYGYEASEIMASVRVKSKKKKPDRIRLQLLFSNRQNVSALRC